MGGRRVAPTVDAARPAAGDHHVVPRRLREAAERAALLWRQGHAEAALAAQREVAEHLAEALGPQAAATLSARLVVAQWLTDSATSRLADGRALVALRQDIAQRGTGLIDIDGFETGLVAAFAEASDWLADLIAETEGALGPDHEVVTRARALRSRLGDHDVPELASRLASEAIDQLVEGTRREIVRQLRALSRRQARHEAESLLPERRRRAEETAAERGPEDPATLGDEYRLVWELARAGATDEALTLAQSVLDRRRRLLGDAHTDTVRARYAVACLRGDRDEFDQAIADLDTIIADFSSIDGPAHATTLAARRVQADFVGYRGDYRRAALLATALLQDAQDLGAETAVIDEAEAAAALWLRLA